MRDTSHLTGSGITSITALLDIPSHIVLLLKRNGRIEWTNDLFSRLYPLPAAGVIGSSILDLRISPFDVIGRNLGFNSESMQGNDEVQARLHFLQHRPVTITTADGSQYEWWVKQIESGSREDLIAVYVRTPDPAPGEYLNFLIDHFPYAAFVADARDQVVCANELASELFRYSNFDKWNRSIDQIIPRTYRSMYDTARRSDRLAHLDPPDGQSYLFLVRSDGTRFPAEITLNPVIHRGLPYVVITVRDLSFRKQIAETLRARESILEAVGYASEQFLTDAPWHECVENILSRIGEATGASRVFLFEFGEAGGITRETSFIEWTATGIIPLSSQWEDVHSRLNFLSRFREKAGRFDGKIISAAIDTLSAAERNLLDEHTARSILLVPVYVGDHYWGIIGLHDCLQERSWMEAEIDALKVASAMVGASIQHNQYKDSLNRLASIVESSDDAIIGKSIDGTITSWNAGAERMYGYTSEEVVGKPSTILFPEEHIQDAYHPGKSLKGEQKFERLETVHQTRDGRRINVSLTRSPIRDADGNLIGVSTISRDISDRKNFEKLLARANVVEQRKIGHELHEDLAQRLASISLLTGVLSQRLEKDGSAHVESARRIESLLSDVVSFSRELTRRIIPVDVQAEGLMYALQHLTESTASAFNIRCAFKMPVPVLVPDSAKSFYLYRIAQEAISSALERGGTRKITLTFTRRKNRGLLKIEDDGRCALDQPEGVHTHSIRSMRHQADVIGGTLTVYRSRTEGTVIECGFDVS